jgi:uncharacterized protein YuzE
MIVEIAESGSAYIRYRPSDQPVSETIEVGGEGSEVMADVNDRGEVIGIEIVDVNVADSIEQARNFARDRGLAFPRDIAAAAKSVSAA